MSTSPNFDYCYKTCPIGKKAADEFLNKNSSAFDAAIDFNIFVKECFKKCPYNSEYEKELER